MPEWAEQTQKGWDMILTSPNESIQQPYAELIAPNTIQFERMLPGPVERVWEYIVDSNKRGRWLATGTMPLENGRSFSLYFRNSDLSTVRETAPPEYVSQDAGQTSECTLTECEPP